MTLAQIDAEIARFRATLGSEKSRHVEGAIAGARATCSSGPDVAEALTNALILHALCQSDPRGYIKSIVMMLNAGMDLFLHLRAEATVRS